MINSLINKIRVLGVSNKDSSILVETKNILSTMAILMSFGGLIWGSLLSAYELYLPALIPYGYIIITFFNLRHFSHKKSLPSARRVQLIASILLPFSLQWVLGGFIASGGVMLWSILGLVGATALCQDKKIWLWLLYFVLLFVISVVWDQTIQSIKPNIITQQVSVLMMVINIFMISMIVFILSKVKVEADVNLRLKIENQNEEIKDSLRELETTTAELRETNAELKKFSHVVSHDLKSPLRAISNLAEIILTDAGHKLDDQNKELFSVLIGRVQRMNGLINGILEYSELGKKDTLSNLVDLDRTVANVIDLLAPSNHITISVASPLPTIKGDPIMLHQVWQNLLGNSIKFSDKEEGRVSISFKDLEKSYEFSIEDNGPGIDEAYHDKVFQIFQTIKPRDDDENTGIGLSIVKKIIELHKGKVWFKSGKEVGVTFFFTLPK